MLKEIMGKPIHEILCALYKKDFSNMHKADDVLGFKKQDIKPRDHNCV